MELKNISDWRKAKSTKAALHITSRPGAVDVPQKWLPPEGDCLKLNVDVSFHQGGDKFSIGLVLRDSTCTFVAGKVLCKPQVDTIFEAEADALVEGFRWLMTMHHRKVIIESDSLLSVQAVHRT